MPSLRQDGQRESSKPTGWDRARLGVVVPLCVVVAVAIVCIIVAALTSAQRADEVALEREKHLFMKAVVNHGEWSMRRLKSVVDSDQAAHGNDIDRAGGAPERIAAWLKPLLDHDFVLMIGSADHVLYAQASGAQTNAQGAAAAFSQVRSLLNHLRGRTGVLPDSTVIIARGDRSKAGVSEAAFLQPLLGQLAVVTVAPVQRARADQPTAEAQPVVLTVRFIEHTLLSNIGDRLQLDNLRKIDDEAVPGDDYVFSLVDRHETPIARFAWTPKRPGAEVLQSVVPFIGIALAGFAVLAGLVLRFMRRTAATIAAGENRLRYLALHDPLCGLPNRIFFSERLEAVIADVKRRGSPAAVFYIDLDHFKDVNDTLGHPVGDELIRSVTLRLSRTLRGDDLVARLGGDEFAVITSVSSDHATLQTIAGRIIATLCAPYSINGHTIVIGASIGIAVIDQRAADAADILRYADMALYRAKNEGRNRACTYDKVMDADLSQRKLLEQDLREAIENNGLKVVYQPFMNASGETVVGVEALARWPHPVRGMIPPSEFIPIAEHSGLILDLGARVPEEAQHVELRQIGPPRCSWRVDLERGPRGGAEGNGVDDEERIRADDPPLAAREPQRRGEVPRVLADDDLERRAEAVRDAGLGRRDEDTDDGVPTERGAPGRCRRRAQKNHRQRDEADDDERTSHRSSLADRDESATRRSNPGALTRCRGPSRSR